MRMLITAGPTREYFDTVRFISNASTGRFGYALAEQARQLGHEVTLVSGPVTLTPPAVRVIMVETAEEMLAAAASAFESCDVAIMAAAVSDWRPARRLDHKAPKDTVERTVRLEPTTDICARLGQQKGSRVLIGFALQDRDGYRNAEAKMKRKCCDAIVLNSPATLASARARIEIKVAGQPWGAAVEGTKGEVAAAIVALAEQLVTRT